MNISSGTVSNRRNGSMLVAAVVMLSIFGLMLSGVTQVIYSCAKVSRSMENESKLNQALDSGLALARARLSEFRGTELDLNLRIRDVYIKVKGKLLQKDEWILAITAKTDEGSEKNTMVFIRKHSQIWYEA